MKTSKFDLEAFLRTGHERQHAELDERERKCKEIEDRAFRQLEELRLMRTREKDQS